LTGERAGYYAGFGRIADIAKALSAGFVYDGRRSIHRGRRHGRPARGLSGHRFLGYLQNHDQIGNRAVGERSGALMSEGLLKVGAALVLTSPFVPMLFMGEEWGASTPWLYFTDHPEPDLAAAVATVRRREFASFGWSPEDVADPQSVESFERSRLVWSELGRERHAELLDWHRRLIALRRSEPALTDGRMDLVATRWDEQARWLVIERGPMTVACNLSDAPVAIPLHAGDVVMTSGAPPLPSPGALRLPPESVTIFRRASSDL
jgi:maltooligosyltrehalose trehalohydrolase